MTFYYWFREGIKPDKGVIYCEIRIDGVKSVPISTKVKLARKNWNSAEQCFEGKDAAKNARIIEFWELRFKQIYHEIISEKPNEPIAPTEILIRHRGASSLERKVRQYPTFLECFKEFLRTQEELVKADKLSEQTVKIFRAKYITLKEYLAFKGLDKIKSDNISATLCEEFKHYLLINRYEASTIEKYLFLIKRVTAFANSRGLAKSKPLDNYKIEKAKSKDPISLTKYELDKMDKLELSEKLRKTVEIARFCAETSLSFCDYNTLDETEYELDEDGTPWIVLGRDKSDTPQRIPLNDKALEIFNKYGGAVDTLPKISNANLNKYIKEIAKMARIHKHLTFHTSRKSFVDYVLNTLELPNTTIQAIVGWKDSRQLSRYAKVQNSTIKRQFLKKDMG